MSYHGGSSLEEMEGSERASRSRRMDPGSRAFSASAIHLSPAASLRYPQPGRPKGYNSEENLYEQIPDNELGAGGPRAPRPSSLENSRNVSASSSPLTLKGSPGFPPGRPDSVSSDDFVPTKEAATLPRDVYISRSGSANKPEAAPARNSPVPYNNAERRPPSRARPRSGSPGSEMVTLEEFLEESNKKSPPPRRHIDRELITLREFLLEADTLHPSSPSPSPSLHLKEPSESSSGTSSPSLASVAWRQRADQADRRAASLYMPRDASRAQEDFLGEYVKKPSDGYEFGSPVVLAAYRDIQSTPNYGNLSAKLSGEAGDVQPGRPGQYVKPNLRPMDPGSSQSLRRPQPQQPVPTSKQVPEPQHPGSLAGRSSSLNRAFSLATADLLKANGPDLNRMEKIELETPMLKDFNSHILRSSTPTGSPGDRPPAARMANLPKGDDLRTRSLDTRRLSLAVPREDKTLQAALSTSCLQQSSGRGRPRPISRYGEVAMVSPVRPISTIPEVEGQAGAVSPKPPSAPSDCHPPTTAGDDPNKTSPKSTPASPDPTADPQTVWYEYGCV